MSISITPRIGQFTRRSDDELKAENVLLIEIADRAVAGTLPYSRARDRLKEAGLIRSYRTPDSRLSTWVLTETGTALATSLRERGKS